MRSTVFWDMMTCKSALLWLWCVICVVFVLEWSDKLLEQSQRKIYSKLENTYTGWRFEVLVAVAEEHFLPCSLLVVQQRFGRPYCCSFQGHRVT
jgi:hypothetical protein